jgi:glutamine amidotransferase
MIAIIDYGVCNVGAVRNLLHRAGLESIVVDKPEGLEGAHKIILPGVGYFAEGMKQLRSRGFVDVLRHHVLEEDKPILGICLGMHLLAEHSEEGDVEGLGFVSGRVVRFDTQCMEAPLPVPHMGWSSVILHNPAAYTAEMMDHSRFYFSHSYHVDGLPASDVVLTAVYGYTFIAGYQCRNVGGIQFHPEKSHVYGCAILKSFARETDAV